MVEVVVVVVFELEDDVDVVVEELVLDVVGGAVLLCRFRLRLLFCASATHAHRVSSNNTRPVTAALMLPMLL
eukprot:m.317 g.317  ORF g.317 m.317 type:complete len:72 (-) comp106_c0_seq1:316-531(-)